jgi:hypothetical protein
MYTPSGLYGRSPVLRLFPQGQAMLKTPFKKKPYQYKIDTASFMPTGKWVYSTFRTSFNAFSSVSLGKAPMAICG